MNQKEKNFVYYELNTTVFEELMLWDFAVQGREENEGE